MKLFPGGPRSNGLALACSRGDIHAIGKSIERGASPHVFIPSRGQTLLAWAVERQSLEVVEALLRGGADPAWTGGGTARQATPLAAWMRRTGAHGLHTWLTRFPSLRRPDTLMDALQASCGQGGAECFSCLLDAWIANHGKESIRGEEFIECLCRLVRSEQLEPLDKLVSAQPALLDDAAVRRRLLAEAATRRRGGAVAWLRARYPGDEIDGTHPARMNAIMAGAHALLASFGPSWSGWDAWRAQVQAALRVQSAPCLAWTWAQAPGGDREKREHLGKIASEEGEMLDPLVLACGEGDPRRAAGVATTLMEFGYKEGTEEVALAMRARAARKPRHVKHLAILHSRMGDAGMEWTARARALLADSLLAAHVEMWEARAGARKLEGALPPAAPEGARRRL